MEGTTIFNNILRLFADMENLRGLGQQAAMVCNTEVGRFKYLVSALFGTCYRAAIVCHVWHSLESFSCLSCMTPAIEVQLSDL